MPHRSFASTRFDRTSTPSLSMSNHTPVPWLWWNHEFSTIIPAPEMRVNLPPPPPQLVS
jgi:hypothetical protein